METARSLAPDGRLYNLNSKKGKAAWHHPGVWSYLALWIIFMDDATGAVQHHFAR